MDVRPRDFGGLGGVAAIDPALRDQTPYFQPLIDVLQDHGYEVRIYLRLATCYSNASKQAEVDSTLLLRSACQLNWG